MSTAPNPSRTPPDTGTPSGAETFAEETAEVIGEVGEVGEAGARFLSLTILNVLAYIGELLVLLAQSIRVLLRMNPGDLVRQMSTIGVDTIPIALLTVGFSGAVLALYTTNTLQDYGASNLVGGIVALSIVRETGPILAGVVCAARAGSAMTAEIGSMKVTEQIDALRSMAISPVEYLVTPRVVASILMLPVLTIFADAAGVFGGAVVASSKGVSFDAYLSSVRFLMMPDGSDIFKGLIKTVFFGAIVALIGCREGLETEGGAVGVGQSTTRSVVVSIVLVFLADFFLSFILFNNGFV